MQAADQAARLQRQIENTTMDKRDLALLETAFAAEVDAALKKSPLYMMQTRAMKRADSLVAEGLLRKVKEVLDGRIGRITVEGYALTEAGRLAVCISYLDEQSKGT